MDCLKSNHSCIHPVHPSIKKKSVCVFSQVVLVCMRSLSFSVSLCFSGARLLSCLWTSWEKINNEKPPHISIVSTCTRKMTSVCVEVSVFKLLNRQISAFCYMNPIFKSFVCALEKFKKLHVGIFFQQIENAWLSTSNCSWRELMLAMRPSLFWLMSSSSALLTRLLLWASRRQSEICLCLLPWKFIRGVNSTSLIFMLMCYSVCFRC